MVWNVLWGHLSAQRLALEGMDHFPTLEIESESNCVLPWLITGWEDRPSQQHNSIWAKYLYRGGTTSLIHNTFIHVRERATLQSWVRARGACQRNITPSLLIFTETSFQKKKKVLVPTRVHNDLFYSCVWRDSLFVSDWEESCQWWVHFFSFFLYFEIHSNVGAQCVMLLK